MSDIGIMKGKSEPRKGVDSAHSTLPQIVPRVALVGTSLPPMTSYAQNFEDVLIRRALQDIAQGYYIDVGAFDATADSVTRWFYDNGWRGVNIEPNPALHARLQRDRPRDENLSCAVSSSSGSVQFQVIEDTGLSTLSVEQARLAKTAGYDVSSNIEVPAQTLDQLLEAYGRERTIDFLKIDIEGSESDVLNSAHFATVRPRLLIIEAVMSFSLEPVWHNWEPELLAKGYTFVWFDGLNRFYLREEDEWRRALFGIPPSVFDNFTGHYYSAAQNELAKRDTLLEIERANVAERETQLDDKSALHNALQTQSQDLARTLAERDLQLADIGAQYGALQTQSQDLARSLAERGLQLTDKSALYDALQTKSHELARSLAEREQTLTEKESAMLVLSLRLDAQCMETRGLLRRNREMRVLIDQMETQISNLSGLLDRKGRELSEISGLLDQEESKLSILSRKIAVLSMEFDEASHAKAELQQAHDDLLSSASWHLTKPIRALARLAQVKEHRFG